MIEIVTAYLTTKSSIYISLLVLLGCISKFAHIIYGVRDTKGIFGYAYMSNFLYTSGEALSFLCVALLIKFKASKTDEQYRKMFSISGNMLIYVACFFLLSIFIPKKILFNARDFPVYFYWVSMLAMSVFTGTIFTYIQKFAIKSEARFKKAFFSLSRFALKDAKQFVKPELTDEYDMKSFEALKRGME